MKKCMRIIYEWPLRQSDSTIGVMEVYGNQKQKIYASMTFFIKYISQPQCRGMV